jgi:hypothetical protein
MAMGSKLVLGRASPCYLFGATRFLRDRYLDQETRQLNLLVRSPAKTTRYRRYSKQQDETMNFSLQRKTNFAPINCQKDEQCVKVPGYGGLIAASECAETTGGETPQPARSGRHHSARNDSATVWKYSGTAYSGEINICQQCLQLPYIPCMGLLARWRLRKRQTKRRRSCDGELKNCCCCSGLARFEHAGRPSVGRYAGERLDRSQQANQQR